MPPFKKTKIQTQAIRVLSGKHTHTMLFGGSRSGKTFILVYATFVRALKEAGTRHLIARLRFNHAKISLVHDTIPKVLKTCFPGLIAPLNKTDYYYELPNGATVWIGGLDDKDRVEKILGNEYSTIYPNECSQIPWDTIEMLKTRLAEKSGLKNKMYYDCNPPNKSHWSNQVFVLGVDPVTKAPKEDAGNYQSLKMNPADNIDNISEDYIKMLEGLSGKKRERFLYGNFTDDNENALWRRDWIANNRQHLDYEQCDRIVIAVDPAVSNTEHSDEHGIIVAGEKRHGDIVKYYIYADYTMKGSPSEWANEVIRLYELYQANLVICEVNNGGDLVTSNIRNLNARVKVEQVRATRGKAVRAEPVSALYEMGRVQHCGVFHDLEDELCEWNPIDNLPSPNRLDALVWGVSYLAGCTNGAPIKFRKLNYTGLGI